MRIELMEPAGGLSPRIVTHALELVGGEVDPRRMDHLTRLELAILYDWAWREHLRAGDNPVRRRDRPWLAEYVMAGLD